MSTGRQTLPQQFRRRSGLWTRDALSTLTSAEGRIDSALTELTRRDQVRSGRRHSVLAALDLGTNNCRLLIARPHEDTFRVIDAFSRIVRLGQGITSTGTLSLDAMDRALDALKVCARKMRQRDVTLSRVVATEACRRARNRNVFIERVKRETGLELEIISNREEAELALTGCMPLFNAGIPNAIVFDIGGGSTELAWIRRGKDGESFSLDVTSMPVGVVTLNEKYGGDRYDPETYQAMVGECADCLEAFDTAHGIAARIRDGAVQILGASGTVTTLAGLRLDLRRYARNRVDGTFLDFSDVQRLARGLVEVNFEDRATHPCIGRDRADLVVGGCAILEAICQKWPVGSLRVADRGVREGILLGLLERAR